MTNEELIYKIKETVSDLVETAREELKASTDGANYHGVMSRYIGLETNLEELLSMSLERMTK